jgi:hypothetical protein
MSRSSLLLALALVVVPMAPGCIFENLDSTTQLTEQVHRMNDDMRWARVDLAAQQVHPDYRETFAESHALWGSDIQIADVEATNIRFETGEEVNGATATVHIAWYDERTMEVYNTTIRQHFVPSDSGYLLDEESIVSGDENLLNLPEEDEESSGDEAPVEEAANSPTSG